MTTQHLLSERTFRTFAADAAKTNTNPDLDAQPFACFFVRGYNRLSILIDTKMGVSEKSNLIIYRFRENGLEVFLVNKEDGTNWQLPQGEMAEAKALAILEDDRVIALDPVEEGGLLEQAYAVEGDWHDIPSLKSILKHDVQYVTDTIKQMVPDMMQKGAFFAVKEAFKKVLPHQYDQLKELKEILIDRNLTKYL